MSQVIFRYGTMNSGKSTSLLQLAHNYERIGKKFYLCKPAIDTKAGDRITSRLGIDRKVDFLIKKDDDLEDILLEKFYNSHCDVCLIDEAQFLTKEQVDQIKDFWPSITFFCYGLRLNAFNNDDGFLGATRLLQISDKIEEIETICECGKKATCNCRFLDNELITKGAAVCIDGETNVEYRALCWDCRKKYAEDSTK